MVKVAETEEYREHYRIKTLYDEELDKKERLFEYAFKCLERHITEGSLPKPETLNIISDLLPYASHDRRIIISFITKQTTNKARPQKYKSYEHQSKQETNTMFRENIWNFHKIPQIKCLIIMVLFLSFLYVSGFVDVELITTVFFMLSVAYLYVIMLYSLNRQIDTPRFTWNSLKKEMEIDTEKMKSFLRENGCLCDGGVSKIGAETLVERPSLKMFSTINV